MKLFLTLSFVLTTLWLSGQNQVRPSYCDELPTSFDQINNSNKALPRFATRAIIEYKVQVALLRFTDPSSYPFHPTLIARYRPCEQVWVVESRQTFKDKKNAQRLRYELERIGYEGAYITELIAYEQVIAPVGFQN